MLISLAEFEIGHKAMPPGSLKNGFHQSKEHPQISQILRKYLAELHNASEASSITSGINHQPQIPKPVQDKVAISSRGAS
jgi:hypothetical protein